MPATGPRAPARTLVAVRAILPVTQMPPNSAEPILATPCATSSQLERWRRPVMPSATTADSSDLDRAEQREGHGIGQHGRDLRRARMPAGAARQSTAGCRRSGCRSSRPAGRERQAATAATATAMKMPGQCGRKRRSTTMMPMRRGERHGRGDRRSAAPASASACERSAPGSGRSVRPSRSLIWLTKMMTAMPAVNPTVTG